MTYLLDVNALLAWEHGNSPHHAVFHAWARRVGRANLWTCAHTELGFLRVSMQVFGYSLAQAAAALAELKQHAGGFVEAAPSPRLHSLRPQRRTMCSPKKIATATPVAINMLNQCPCTQIEASVRKLRA